MNKPVLFRPMRLWVCGALAVASMMALPVSGQTLKPRIHGEVSSAEMTPLGGSLHPLARPEFDAGPVAGDTRLTGITLEFTRTANQQANLDALTNAQQNTASPLYHKWLTPEQFAARFGMAQSDLTKVQSWLEQQGFSIDSVARSRNELRFSGTAIQVNRAFATELHYYNIKGERHMAPSTELSVPSALASTVLALHNLDSFRPRAQVVFRKNAQPRRGFTSGISGNVFFAPGDIVTVYDIKPVYSAGFNGSGQKIAVIGQSAITVSDVENFQSAAGLKVKDPTVMLMPGTGTSTLSAGDEAESDLDLEWSGAIAPGADIVFIYTGSDQNYSAFDALKYAVENNLAPIISSSYGVCEPELGGYSLESTLEQAAAQGQTVISASGDTGSTGCYEGNDITDPSQAIQQSLAVNYPASSPWVTGMGGTEVSQTNSDYLTSGTAYWADSSNGDDVISSALQYLPEVVWNDDDSSCGTDNCLSASGGGASTLFSKPTWQTGVPGIPADGKRDVPDMALYASPNFPGYIYCSSDSSAWNSGQAASCNAGFRDGSSEDLTIAGGTSFAAPIFAGMVALINQQANYAGGQGLINKTLYSLAADSTTYAAAFHDIVSGNNDCTAGSSYCASTAGFSAGAGYDQVTGLGSVDLATLATAWPAGSGGGLIGTATSVTPSIAAPAVNVSDTFTVTVTSDSGNTVPTGSVTFAVDGATPGKGIPLNGTGSATYTTSFATAAVHTVVAAYSGDTTHAASSGSVSVTVGGGGTGNPTFTVAATNVTVTDGSTGTSTVTVTPKGGYTGTVDISLDTSNDNALQNVCFDFPNLDTNGDGAVMVSGTAAVSAQLTIDTNAANCIATGESQKGHGMRSLRAIRAAAGKTAHNNPPAPTGRAPLALAFAGLLLAGCVSRSARRFRALAGVVALAAIGLALSACGGLSSNTSNPPAGTYTVTLTGQDSASSTIPTATTTFTLTIQ